MTISNILKLIV